MLFMVLQGFVFVCLLLFTLRGVGIEKGGLMVEID